jgi:hypothetical protein
LGGALESNTAGFADAGLLFGSPGGTSRFSTLAKRSNFR